jgi:RimJ/RimL family protein N-acetyltransferase
MQEISIRMATLADDAALRDVDQQTWSASTAPTDRWPADQPFFTEFAGPELVVVADVDGTAIGYSRLEPIFPVPSARHVLGINGFAVHPRWQGRGVAGRLLMATIELARNHGARKLTLRVLASNPGAVHVYRRAGFVEEGRLTGLFLLEGRYVDDLLMSLDLSV